MAHYVKENDLYIPDNIKAHRRDFMKTEKPGSSKGVRGKDPLKSQYQYNDTITQHEIDNMYKHKRIFQNIIDIPAEDATREWISFEDTPEAEEILNKLNDLDAQPVFEKFLEYERLTGDGFVSLGVSQSGPFEIDDELDETRLNNIDYIHPFSKKKVVDGLLDEDPFSRSFNNFSYYELKPLRNETRLVHSSRILHLQTRVFEGDKWGTSLGVPLYEPILILDNIAWSLGQIAYAMTFKVLKSSNINMKNKEQAKSVAEEMEKFFNSMSLAVIGKDEELSHEGPGGSLPNLTAMTEFIWDFLAGSARMPKSHMLGQQQGTITGGEFDSLNYYMRVSGIQENYMRPPLERLISLLYKARDSGVGNGRVEEPEFKLEFKPLWKLDRETDMKIRKLQSEIDDKYIKNMVLNPDEVREVRFGKDGFMDSMDLKKLAFKVDEKRQDNGFDT